MSERTAKIGPYALTQCLESGSAVQLWLARRDDETVTVRLVADPTDEMAIERWETEKQLLQSLKHSAVPSVLAVFEDEKAFVLERMGGVGLEELVAARAANSVELAPGTVLQMGLGILDVLKEIAETGHLHGNLSPARVRFSKEAAVQISGWGVRPEQVQPCYMAPEMTGEGEVGHQTDLWHVAVIIFELLMGRPIYEGGWGEVFKKALDGDNSEACEALIKAYPAFEDALCPALRRDGFERFEDHDAMISALSSALLGVGTGPTFAQVISGFEGDHSPILSSTEEDETSDELEIDTPPPAPQLERVEIILPEIAAPEVLTPVAEVDFDVVQEEPEPVLQEENTLGAALTEWEKKEMACCEAADPVERGSWWVTSGGETTALPEDTLTPEPDLVLKVELQSEPEVAEEPEPEVVEEPEPEVVEEPEPQPAPEVVDLTESELLSSAPVEPPKLPPLPPLSLPGLEAVSKVLQEEAEESELLDEQPDDFPWSEPAVIIPGPPSRLEELPPSGDTPAILSPRTQVPRNRAETHDWEQGWGVQPLSHRIARSGLLVLLGMVLAWLVLG